MKYVKLKTNKSLNKGGKGCRKDEKFPFGIQSTMEIYKTVYNHAENNWAVLQSI